MGCSLHKRGRCRRLARVVSLQQVICGMKSVKWMFLSGRKYAAQAHFTTDLSCSFGIEKPGFVSSVTLQLLLMQTELFSFYVFVLTA